MLELPEPLITTSAVIDALGGNEAAARLTGRGKTAPYNWRQWPRFPADTYLVMHSALAAKGLFAPPWLWRQGPLPAKSTKADTPEVA